MRLSSNLLANPSSPMDTANGMDWIKLVGDIGFPIVVALILLLRLDTTMHKLKESVDDLTRIMRIYLKLQGHWGRKEDDNERGGD